MKRQTLYMLFIACFVVACGDNKKVEDKKKSINLDSNVIVSAPRIVYQQDIAIYLLDSYENEGEEDLGFISLSDSYIDSVAIPGEYLGKKKLNEVKRFELTGFYREKFLKSTHISEADQLFIYNYMVDSLLAISVKDLTVVGRINIYASDFDTQPYSENDFMVGFEIKGELLKGFKGRYYPSLVYVGEENPFIQGEMKPIVWEKIKNESFYPSKKGYNDGKRMPKFLPSVAYKSKMNQYEFYVQDFIEHDRPISRHIIVIDSKTKFVVYDEIYETSEGSSLAPLNKMDPEHRLNDIQWAGFLFKNKPPVMFGFTFVSFGCSSINFLKLNESPIYILCDNRH